MLYLAYLGEARKLNIEDNIKKYLIVRKPVGSIPRGFIHVPQLSPSIELFNDTQRWKKNDFTKEEIELLNNVKVDREDKKAWLVFYVKSFNKELTSRPDMRNALSKLKSLLDKGEDIFLFCYCKSVDECHRGLIGKYLELLGYKVDYGYRTECKLEETDATEVKQITLFDFI